MNLKVIPATNPDWFTPWIVSEYHNNIIKDYEIKTIDIYTYLCINCNNTECIHSKAVTKYVKSELDKWIKQKKLESNKN